jgi:hypothetical protein
MSITGASGLYPPVSPPLSPSPSSSSTKTGTYITVHSLVYV